MADLVHYVGKVKITCGEYDFDSVFRFETAGDPDAYIEKLARRWYDGKAEKVGSGYSFAFDELFVKNGCFQAVSKEVFDGLDPIIVKL